METRSIKELLQLTLTIGNKQFKGEFGLCGLVLFLYLRGNITLNEYNDVNCFIINNRPQKGSPHYIDSYKDFAYFWKPGCWDPRKKWLENQIKNM
jgi:hypothetical protein